MSEVRAALPYWSALWRRKFRRSKVNLVGLWLLCTVLVSGVLAACGLLRLRLPSGVSAGAGEVRTSVENRTELLKYVVDTTHTPTLNVMGKSILYEDGDLHFTASAEDAREKVKEAMVFAWDQYVRYAWGADEIAPVSRSSRRTFGGCTGITILDAADTLFLMGLEAQYKRARDWISKVDFACVTERVSVFETTIRSLGGLLSLLDLTGDDMYLRKAEHLGQLLSKAFDCPGIPARNCRLASSSCQCSTHSSIANAGTLQLEWRALAFHTSDQKLKDASLASMKVMENLIRISRDSGVMQAYVIALRPDKGKLTLKSAGSVRLGGEGDSYFEYLLKLHLQSQGSSKDEIYRREFRRQIKMILEKHVSTDWPHRLIDKRGAEEMEHLACFLPGSMALEVMSESSTLNLEEKAQWTAAAANLTETCYLMYYISPIGLSPDAVILDAKNVRSKRSSYLQRPEVIEALFYLWRLTRREKYRAWAWKIFEAIQRETKVEHGYSGIRNVMAQNKNLDDVQQSFFLAETLKYLYLIFSEDDVLPLDQWIFNTEAHPFRVRPEIAQ